MSILLLINLILVTMVIFLHYGPASSHSASQILHAQSRSLSKPATSTTGAAPATTRPQSFATASMAPFVGSWYMHDGYLTIAADGYGTMALPGIQYGECYQISQIRVSSAFQATAVATITSITATCKGDAPTFNPRAGGGISEELDTGSTITLTLSRNGIQTSVGVEYCYLAEAALQACGA